MSLGVQVHKEPYSIYQGKTVILSNVDALRKEELERRRKLRLEQVRYQSKEFSNKVLQKVQHEQDKNMENERRKKEAELKQWQAEKIKSLGQKYQECLDSVCHSQNESKKQISEEEARKEKLLEERDNIRKARERGKQAIEKLKLDKRAEEKKKEMELKQKQYASKIEKLRSTLLTSNTMLANPADSETPHCYDASDSQTAAQATSSQNRPQANTAQNVAHGSGSQNAGSASPNKAQAFSSQTVTQTSSEYDRRLYQTSTSRVENERVVTSTKEGDKKSQTSRTKPDSTSQHEKSLVETLEEERKKLVEYKSKLESEERKRHILEEKLRLEAHSKLNAQLMAENEKLKRENMEEEERRREKEKTDRQRGKMENAKQILDEMREQDCERKLLEDEEEERKLEDYRRELERMHGQGTEEENKRGRKRMKVNIITSSSRRSKSCNTGSCIVSSTESDVSFDSFLSEKTWPPRPPTSHKCHKHKPQCTSKKLPQPKKPPSIQLEKKLSKHSGVGGVRDRSLQAFEKVRLNKDFKTLISQLEHLSREETRIKSHGCFLHHDPLLHMTDSRRQAVSQVRQNRTTSTFQEISTGYINPLDKQTNPLWENPMQKSHAGTNSHIGENSHANVLHSSGKLGTTVPKETLEHMSEIPVNVATLKQLLERVNQDRALILSHLSNTSGTLRGEAKNLVDGTGQIGGLYNIQEESVSNLTDTMDVINNLGPTSVKETSVPKQGNISAPQSRQSRTLKDIQVSPRDSGQVKGLKFKRAARNEATAVWSTVIVSEDPYIRNENGQFDEHIDGDVVGPSRNDSDRNAGGVNNTNEQMVDSNNQGANQSNKSTYGRVMTQSQAIQTEIQTGEKPLGFNCGSSVQRFDLNSQNQVSSVQRLMTSHQSQTEHRESSTWAEELASQPRKGQGPEEHKSQHMSPVQVRQKISAQSETTRFTAGQDAHFVVQVETTSSTTEIEMSSLEPAVSRSRRKKHRKAAVGFPPSPIPKVKQVRKTLFNDNIEVIVNIKDTLGAALRDDLKEKAKHNQQTDHSQFPAKEKLELHSVEHHRQFDSWENRSYEKCELFPDKQTQRYACVSESETISTDETRSSYMSPPRRFKTIHEKDIKQLISHHCLPQRKNSPEKIPQGEGKNNIAENFPETNVHGSRLEPQETRNVKSQKMKTLVNAKQKGPISNEINNDFLELINEKLNREQKIIVEQAAKDQSKKKPKDQKILREFHVQTEKDDECFKTPAESVAPNAVLLNYMVTLLNKDKKDIEGIPIEVSDVSIASELYASTSETSNANEQNNNDPLRGKYDGLKDAKVEQNDKLSLINHKQHKGLIKPTGTVAVDLDENLAQKYTDLVHQKAKAICSNQKSRQYWSEILRTNEGRKDTELRRTLEEYPIDIKRCPDVDHLTPYVPVVQSGYKTEESCTRRVCQKPVGASTLNQGIKCHPKVTSSTLTGTLAQSIANAGAKLPYKEIFQSNLREHCTQDIVGPTWTRGKESVPFSDKIGPALREDEENIPPRQQTNSLRGEERGTLQKETFVPLKGRDTMGGQHRGPTRAGGRQSATCGFQPKHQSAARPCRQRSRPEPTLAKLGAKVPPRPRSKDLTRSAHPLTADISTQSRPLDPNTSILTEQSTVYLNIPPRFDNVEAVGIEDQRDLDVHVRDKWKLVRDICTGKKISLAERRQVVKDICAGAGVKLRGANVSDVEKQLLFDFEPRKSPNVTNEKKLNDSMDLQLPDVCLERPGSKQNSDRKSQADLNSTLSTGGYNVDSLIQELIQRGIIERPFPWLANINNASGTMDDTNLTEALQQLLDGDTGSDRTPPLTPQIANIQTTSSKEKNSPSTNPHACTDLNRSLDVTAQTASNPVAINGDLNQTSSSLRCRKTDLLTIFEDYKRDIRELLKDVPSPEQPDSKPIIDFTTLLSLDSELTSPGDVENLALEDYTVSNGSKNTTTNGTNDSVHTTESNMVVLDKINGSRIATSDKDDSVNTTNNTHDASNAQTPPVCSSPVKDGQDALKGQRPLDERSRKSIKPIPIQPMPSEEFVRQLKAITDGAPRRDKSPMMVSKVVDNISSIEPMQKDAFRASEESREERKSEDALSRGSAEHGGCTPAGNNNEAEYKALSAQLSQLARNNAAVDAEWKQLLSSTSSESVELSKRLHKGLPTTDITQGPVAANSSSEDIEQRLASLDPESGRSSWMGATYKTIRQRQQEMLDSSDMTSPEERRPRRKTKRISQRNSTADIPQEDSFKSLKTSMDSVEITNMHGSVNYEAFLRNRQSAMDANKSTRQSLEHAAGFAETTPPSTQPPTGLKYTSSTPVKKFKTKSDELETSESPLNEENVDTERLSWNNCS